MTTPYQHITEDPHVVCRRCGAANGACSLNCPTLRLSPGWAQSSDEEDGQ